MKEYRSPSVTGNDSGSFRNLAIATMFEPKEPFSMVRLLKSLMGATDIATLPNALEPCLD